MFYTKYRPQNFSDILKPNATVDALVTQIKAGKTVHAYLFVGPRGVGKTTTARILTKALNCAQLLKNGDPCDKCSNCKAIKSGVYNDLIEIDAASNRGIDDIRDLREKVKLAPSIGKLKIYIIDEVHMLTTEAFNALLKTLEEPPKHVVFILCTTELHKVPDTIKSRCQVFKFKRATNAQLIHKLSKIVAQEKADISVEDLTKIAQASHGGYRDAETLLQQVIEGSVSVEVLLSVESIDSYIDFVDFLIECNVSAAIDTINNKFDEGKDLYVWTGEILKYLRTLLFIVSQATPEVSSDYTKEMWKKIESQAAKLNVTKIIKIIEVLMKAQNLIKSSFITQLPLELAVVELCNGETNDRSLKKTLPNKPEPNKEKVKIIIDTEVESDADNKEFDGEILEFDENAIQLRFEDLVAKWPNILSQVVKVNHGISALLKNSKPVKIEKNFLILEVLYSFHKERLENTKNRKMVETAFEDVLGIKINIKCVVTQKKTIKISSEAKEIGLLTDYNVTVPAENVIDMFDGALPLLN